MGHQRCSRAHARGCGRGLAASVPAADDDDIEAHDAVILAEQLIFNKLFRGYLSRNGYESNGELVVFHVKHRTRRPA